MIYNGEMQSADPLASFDHPMDVLARAIAWQSAGIPVALAVIVATDGGAVRAPGALMAVSGDGLRAGYLSGGCIDGDVVLNAQQALADGGPRRLRYGTGSPFADIRLPCGGGIDVITVPAPDRDVLRGLCEQLSQRQPARLFLDGDGQILQGPSGAAHRFEYRPRLALRIAGRGADCLALARLARASLFDVRLQVPDEADHDAARAGGLVEVTRLQTPSALPVLTDDAETAFVLMFHDLHWEAALLRQALAGPAFYIGAVGSRKAQAARRAHLLGEGISPADLQRITGPIGLVPSLRDASMLAVSVLAEIVDRFQVRVPAYV